jgi:hypothetical protein
MIIMPVPVPGESAAGVGRKKVEMPGESAIKVERDCAFIIGTRKSSAGGILKRGDS